jgi:hypothetical protein
MRGRAYKAISIWDIAPTATEADIRNFFVEQLAECDPHVRPLVRHPKSHTQSTVVTLARRDGDEAMKDIKKGRVLKDSTGTVSNPGFSTSFLDLTLLENTSENPAFEFVFPIFCKYSFNFQ